MINTAPKRPRGAATKRSVAPLIRPPSRKRKLSVKVEGRRANGGHDHDRSKRSRKRRSRTNSRACLFRFTRLPVRKPLASRALDRLGGPLCIVLRRGRFAGCSGNRIRRDTALGAFG